MDPADRRCLSEDRSANSIATLKKQTVCGSEMHKALLHVIDILCRKSVWLWKPVSRSRKPTQKSGCRRASNHVLMRCGRLPTDARSVAFCSATEDSAISAAELATYQPLSRRPLCARWLLRPRGGGGQRAREGGPQFNSIIGLGNFQAIGRSSIPRSKRFCRGPSNR